MIFIPEYLNYKKFLISKKRYIYTLNMLNITNIEK